MVSCHSPSPLRCLCVFAHLLWTPGLHLTNKMLASVLLTGMHRQTNLWGEASNSFLLSKSNLLLIKIVNVCLYFLILEIFSPPWCTQIAQYWVIQAGLLTPLTFAWHRLSPLAAFTSGAYFLSNGRRWQWICEFYTANFKGIFGGP